MARAVLLCLWTLALALAQEDCIWDKVVEQSDEELFLLVGVQLSPEPKIDAPRLAVVPLTQRAAAVPLTLPGVTETTTGQVSEIITVLDGSHFVVASAGIGLFLISLDTSGRAEIVSNFSAPNVCHRTRLATDIDREYVYFVANDTVYVMGVSAQALTLVGSVTTSPEIGGDFTSIAVTPDMSTLLIGSSHRSMIAGYDIATPSAPGLELYQAIACNADIMVVGGNYLYTGNDTAICVFDRTEDFWCPGQIPLNASYLSTSTFDPWIYITETSTSNSMILALFANSSWNVNITQFSAPLSHPSCVAVKHSAMVSNEVFLACDNVLLSAQYICPQHTTSTGATTGTGSASSMITTATLQATFTTAPQISGRHHSHTGRTVGIVFGTLLLVALLALGAAAIRFYWRKHSDGSESAPLL